MAQVGLLDENFFFYWEDGDWCRRFKEHSWQVWCEPCARVIHYEHKSSDHQSVRLVIEFHRSVYRYYCKHHARGARAPLRIIAASGLIARAGLILLGRSIRHSFHQPETT
jgi:GT2 family glycosyltransferase